MVAKDTYRDGRWSQPSIIELVLSWGFYRSRVFFFFGYYVGSGVDNKEVQCIIPGYPKEENKRRQS